jgi:outer membrane protein assembly factor BamD (BamD/ComL family)
VRGGAPLRQARPVSPSDQLAREVRALELAHRALTEHDPRAALARLDRYRAQFPGGSLSSEAAVLRAQALLASGDRAGAQAVADSFSAAHPDSPYASRLKEIVRSE